MIFHARSFPCVAIRGDVPGGSLELAASGRGAFGHRGCRRAAVRRGADYVRLARRKCWPEPLGAEGIGLERERPAASSIRASIAPLSVIS